MIFGTLQKPRKLDQRSGNIQGIEFIVVYSRRHTLGISVLPDSSVIVRVPFRTPDKTITRIVQEKASWIIKHRDRYKNLDYSRLKRLYNDGGSQMFRGKELLLKIEKSVKSYITFKEDTIQMGLPKPGDSDSVKKLLYKGYTNEAKTVFPEMMLKILQRYAYQEFKPSGLIIRSMKRRWGSCSYKGVITLSTELIKLSDYYIEYVIVHELCHLKHHNHGAKYYELLTELFPEWKSVRKELRKYIQ